MSNKLNDDSLNLLSQYNERNGTHDKRFLVLMDKHLANLKSWMNLIDTTPVNAPEFRTTVETLWNEEKELFESFQEVMQDLSEDLDLLIDVFRKNKESQSE